jgi:hypothetical protein
LVQKTLRPQWALWLGFVLDGQDIMSTPFWVSPGLPMMIRYFQQHWLRRGMTNCSFTVTNNKGEESEVNRSELVDVVHGHLLDYQGHA